jgi:hypothetical protein
MANTTLKNAAKAKNDEFYTQITDIEKECAHYVGHFEGKTIFCNCDDPDTSNFWRYFHTHFSLLGLKKLTSTHFVYQDMFHSGDTYKIEYSGGNDSDFTIGKKTTLKENGDFRSDECIEILKKCDIVTTNPPFSLFREYMAQLLTYNKKFLIIGHQNAITYKGIFQLIRDNKLWLGHNNFDNSRFIMPSYYDITKSKYAYEENGIKYGRVSGLRWYTNIDHKKRHDNIILYRKYKKNEKEYLHYDNYNAIEVSSVAEIPADYEGVMGVPVTFMDKYNPDQFELIGSNRDVEQDPNGIYGRGSLLNSKETFKRLFIKRKK